MRGLVSKRVSASLCASCRAVTLQAQRRFASSTTPDIYDVVTVGGGPAGLALLAALSMFKLAGHNAPADTYTESSPKTRHLKTALVETQDLGKQAQWSLPPDQYSNRASSLTPFSVEFLEHSGTWKHIDQARTQPYNEMQVWDASNDATINFDWRAEAERYNAPPRVVATMTENSNLTRGLLERLHELDAKGSLLSNTKVTSIEMGQDDPDGLDLSNWPILSLEQAGSGLSSKMAARLLVGADGFNSPVRSFAGINSHGWDYARHGVVATLKIVNPEFLRDSYAVVAYQRFLPQLGGPIAILPLPDGYASMVWSTTPANATYLKSLSVEALTATINAALRLEQVDIKYMFREEGKSSNFHQSEYEWRIQHLDTQRSPAAPTVLAVQDKSLASFPLRFRHATTLIGPRIALVGDAAHTIHPLAGQGLNLGLGDARSLAECIAYSVEHGMDIGDTMALERYSSDRFGKGLMMAGGVDALNWMYQLGNGDGIVSEILSRARGLGMKVFDSSFAEQTGLKGRIMRVAEGF